jgi:AraC family transcriptional regulator of adaptative response / methylphosphotriester-DNA alkyltransferase methyltransferase
VTTPSPAATGLTISQRRFGPRRVLAARGRIDRATAPRLAWAFTRATSSEEPIAVDLAAAELADEAGALLLLNAMRRLHALQRELIVVCPPRSLRQALDHSGLARRFELLADANAFAALPPHSGGDDSTAPRASARRAARASTAQQRAVLLADATLVIERRHGEPDLVLDDVAREIATSRRQLQRVFAELAGSAFRDELAAVRMQHGAALLQTTDLPVTEISRRVGYRQPAQFAKAFRRYHGVAPTTLRRAARRQGDPGAADWTDPGAAWLT